jgi:hypothetical protein
MRERAARRLLERLDAILLLGPLVGDEKAAVRAFEALVPLGRPAEQLCLEGLPAVRADDLVRRLRVGGAGHGTQDSYACRGAHWGGARTTRTWWRGLRPRAGCRGRTCPARDPHRPLRLL